MATAMNLNVNDNGFRASKLLVDGGGYFAKQLLLQNAIQGTTTTFDEFLAEKPARQTIRKLKRKTIIKDCQFDIIFPKNGSPTNLDEWDITLVTLILKNCFTLSPAEYIAVQDIRDLRNTLYGHISKVELTDAEFVQKWTDISSTLTKHITLLTNPDSVAFIQDMINRISKEKLSADAAIHTLKEWYEWGMEVEQKLEEMIEDQRTLFSEAETKSEDRHRDTIDQHVNTQTYLGDISNNVSLLLRRNKEAKEETVDRRELNRKIKQAKLKLEAHQQNLEKFNIPCKTRMTEAVTQLLQKNKIVVLKGIPGSGKSHLAKNVLNHFRSLNPEIDPLIISKASEIERVLDPDGSFVLLVDDMIGKISVDATEYKSWIQYIETFMSHVNVGQLFVVLTIRTAIFRQCHKQEMSDIFATENILDTDIYLLENEKRDILELYRQYHNVKISSDQSDKIVQQQYVGIGFPLLCRMMIGHDVEEMFSRPTEYIKNEISPLASEDPLVFVTLFMTLIGDSILSKNELELTQDQKACFKTLNGYFKTSKMDMNKIYQKAQMIEKTFLTFDENKNNFSFIHESVAHSTFQVALEIQPVILIEQCPLDSLIRNMNLITETTNIELKPTDPYMLYRQHIINRMIDVMAVNDSSNIRIVTSASIWKDKAFVDEAISMFDTRHLYLKDEKGMSLLIHFAGFGRKYALKCVLARLEKENQIKVENQLQLALEIACASAEKECVDYLLTKVAAINGQVVIAAVKGGNLKIVKQNILNFGIDKIETLKEQNTDRTLLHIAAERGHGDIVTYLHHICPCLRDKTDKKGCNAIHLSAKCVTKGAIECLKLFNDMDISPYVKTLDGESILSQAVRYGDMEIVKYICKMYPELLHSKDNYGHNALHDAAANGNILCMKFLIEKGLSPTERDYNANTILHNAAYHRNITTLKYICDTYPDLLPLTDNNGFNVLHIAAYGGNIECVEFLINKVLNPTEKKGKHGTILHSAATGGNIATLKYIFDTYPDLLPVTTNNGLNALHNAASRGTVECVKFLIDKGIDPGDRTFDGKHILHMSVIGGNIATMEYICDTYSGLLPVTDNNGLNALHQAANGGPFKCVKFLIDKGIDPRDRTFSGKTILHCSAIRGKIATLEYIYEKYSSLLPITDNDGFNALHHAALSGTVECVKFLIDKVIDPGHRTFDGKTILHCSVIGGKIATLEYIYEKCRDLFYALDNCGLNALHHAALGGTIECIKFLIGKGMSPGDSDFDSKTILHYSVIGRKIDTMEYICETYPDLLSVTDIHGCNALYQAALNGTVECVKFLIDKGIDPLDRISDGRTILHLSAKSGNIATLKYICDTYPDLVLVTDNDDYNALHDTAYSGYVECVKVLIDKGIDPLDRISDGRTILHLSAKSGNIATLKYICDTYPDLVLVTDNDDYNALHDTAYSGYVECVKVLIDKGIDPGDRSSDGRTILHLSATGNIATLKYICDTYPDILPVTDNNGYNALYHAVYSGTVECVKFLIDKGIDPRKRSPTEKTILHMSAMNGNKATLKYICETYPDLLHATDNFNRNALHAAVVANRGIACLDLLLDQNIDPETVNGEGRNILHIAIKAGNAEMIQFVITKCNRLLNTVHIAIVRDLLNTAIETGNTEMTELCLNVITEKINQLFMFAMFINSWVFIQT